MPALQPTAAGERAPLLDILRGVALLGILLANSAVFSLFIFLPPEAAAALPTASADPYLRYLHYIFVDAKFYSLFSLLFGVGFALFFFTKDAGRGLRLFYRRLLVLALFGLAHSLLLWDGDILLFYALTGALLPLFRNVSDRVLLTGAVLLLLSPLLFDAAKVLTGGRWNISASFYAKAEAADARSGITPGNVATWLKDHPTYGSLLDWSRSGFWWGWALRMDSNRIPKVLAMFAIGLVAGRRKMWAYLQAYRPLLRRVLMWGGTLGGVAGIVRAHFETDGKSLPAAEGLIDTLLYALNAAPLALAYAAAMALLWMRRPGALLWKWLAPVGRMALTNYILQSLISVSLYYGVGAGLAPVGPTVFIPVAVLIFLGQVILSRWWLSRFQYGPLEWIWRMLTYGRLMSIRYPVPPRMPG